MTSLKSAAIVGLLMCVIGVPRSVAAQWPAFPTPMPGQIDRTAEEARQAQEAQRVEEQARAAQAWQEMQDRQNQQNQQNQIAEQQWRQALEDSRRTSEATEANRKLIEWTFPEPSWEQIDEQRILAAEKNYKEMTEAALELVGLSQRINNEISGDSLHVLSKSMLKDLDKLEKLAKKVRNRGRRLPKNVVKP